MASATIDRPIAQFANLEDLLHCLGDIPPERILVDPPIGTATEEDVIRYVDGDEKRLVELIDGVLVEKAPGMKESILVSRLSHFLWNYLDENDIGFAFAPDGMIRIRFGRIRLPDAGFVSWKQLGSEEIPNDAILDVMPELTIEVLSKSNTPREIEMKLDDYFEAGGKLAWIVDPETETVTVWTARTKPKVLAKDGTLEGGKVLPGFSLPVEKIFAKAKPRKKRK